ncbi:unnamed protein product [Didymodactylos carnosus]|uniref:F-box domain-containing protein n=1 Tax=Didymodactylos carnosus TaxID=1234261 RepID=A0A813SVN9_9BILA|nr:unnamed protein product [Didymodactylos carnosus]CAF1117785.1 unnamed protein product [Didymodactylos carnosus]CAF3588337.1 unnamed protein product [Didymodactylos carnosus]CAF3889294.1 unnamed protein product [Didymodactylos carnosus]
MDSTIGLKKRASFMPQHGVLQRELNSLPEKVLLYIFSFLPHQELIRCARVCRFWRQLTQNSKLWKTVLLRPEYHGLHVKNIDQFLILVGHRFALSLQYIELPMELITADVLHELANRCPNLKYMTLDFSTAMQLHDFNDLNVFPCNLKMLCICLSEVIFLEGFMRRIYTYLSSLEILHVIGIEDSGILSAEWESSYINELDISSTELTEGCLLDLFSRLPKLNYLAVPNCDGFTDKVLELLIDQGKLSNARALDLSNTVNLNFEVVFTLLKHHARHLQGICYAGNPKVTEQFWTNTIKHMKHIKIIVMGTSNGWFKKISTRIHVDQILEACATECQKLERLEIQWDEETLRWNENSSKFIDHVRIRCTKLQSLVLSDGEYYEVVKSNFERADRSRVVRTTTTYQTSIVSLLRYFNELRFN